MILQRLRRLLRVAHTPGPENRQNKPKQEKDRPQWLLPEAKRRKHQSIERSLVPRNSVRHDYLRLLFANAEGPVQWTGIAKLLGIKLRLF